MTSSAAPILITGAGQRVGLHLAEFQRDEQGNPWTMVQIAGLIARRIVCRVDEGDALARGQRYGMIRFGSRVDLYLPQGYVAATSIGEQVFAGQTVVARAN